MEPQMLGGSKTVDAETIKAVLHELAEDDDDVAERATQVCNSSRFPGIGIAFYCLFHIFRRFLRLTCQNSNMMLARKLSSGKDNVAVMS